MSFKKLGESFAIQPSSIQSAESVLMSEDINARFEKFARELKRIAPKADDFLYFSTAMMTAAERSLYNDDGSIKLGKDGSPVEAKWSIGKDGPESLRWDCSDKSIRPYKNNNGDIFPEAELVKAHKLWAGKPLCCDHISNSVDGIRGVVVDTYYDFKSKQVIALCALDKVSYPDLARKVSTGYSTSVSMGTIVEKAVCGVDTCNKVARSEKDFCDHMRTKHADGEINCQLKPIELSIVVNPADPSAKIRTIFASVQKLQNHKYSADIKEQMTQLEADITEAQQKLGELRGISDEQARLTETEETPLQANAEWKLLFNELKTLKTSMEKTLHELNKTQEDTMADDNSIGKKAYHLQGTNELLKPADLKYPSDPTGERLRNNEDRQMLQDGEYGGSKDDDLRKVRPGNDRLSRRAAALESAKQNLSKSGYMLVDKDGKLVPHKKYDIDPLVEELREKGDRMMLQDGEYGGSLDDDLRTNRPGMNAKDEARRPKLVQKAALKARYFRKAAADGSVDLANSGWQILTKDEEGEKLVFTASVDEISGGQVEQLSDMIATKEFGTKMLEKVREVGVEKAASLYKRAQALPAAPAPDAAAPAAPALPDDATPATDEGGTGNKKETAEDLAEKIRDNASDLLEVVRDVNGSQAEMGELENGISALPAATASVLAPAVDMRKKLEKMIVSAAKKSLSELKEHFSELKLIADMADGDAVKTASISTMIDSAFEEAEAALADSNGVLRSYATYASGVENLQARVKQAQDSSSSDDDMKADDGTSEEMDAADDFLPDFGDGDTDPMGDTIDLHNDHADGLLDEELGAADVDMSGPDTLRMGPDDLEAYDQEQHNRQFGMDDMDANDMNANKLEVTLPPGSTVPAPGQPLPPGAVVAPKTATDLTTREGRQAYRLKLADDLGDIEDASKIKYNPILNDAHKDLDQEIFDGPDPDGLSRFETKEEQHKRTLEVAKAPVRVRKEAARLQKLISEGSIDKSDLPKLVSEGLDAEVVAYWKELYDMSDAEGKEFAKLLTTAADEEKAKEELDNYKLKLARSFQIANEMARTGLISNESGAINRQVEESMGWNDEAFDSFKRVLARRSVNPTLAKTAGFVPQNGITGSNDEMVSTASDDLQSELDRAFAGRKY